MLKDVLMTKKKLKILYLTQRDKLGRPPKKSEFKQNILCKKLYHNYNDFMREMGDIPYFNRTKEDYLKMVLKITKEIGHTPSVNEASKNGIFIRSIVRLFGTWNSFLKEAGLEINEEKNQYDRSKNELLKYYITLCNKANKLLSMQELRRISEVKINVYQNRFSSYSNLIEEALKNEKLNISNKHYEYVRFQKYKTEDLKKQILEFYKSNVDHTKKSFQKYLKENKLASVTTYMNRFSVTSFKELLYKINVTKERKN